jgi:hypothetical protein
MRLILCTVVLICFELAAQVLVGQVDPAIVAYLKLTPDQLQAIGSLRNTYVRDSLQRTGRLVELQTLIAAETRKEVPDAATLGRYEAETIRLTRAISDGTAKLGADERGLLTPEQIALLAPLKEVQRLSALTSQMECEGFLEAPTPTFGLPLNRPGVRLCFTPGPIPTSARASGASGKTPEITPSSPLALYLGLTPDQVRSITALQQDSLRLRAEKSRRSSQVQAELTVESAKPELDELGLGLRMVEIETINREVVQEQKDLAAAIQAKLDPGQLTKLQALEAARVLGALDSAAQSEGFLIPVISICTTLVPMPGCLSIFPQN